MTHKAEVESIYAGMKPLVAGPPQLAGEALVNEKLARSIAVLKDFKPLREFILVRIDSNEKSAGGIILPENRKERPVMGTVVAVGPAVVTGETGISLNDRVLFGKYAGVEVEMPDGERLTDHRVLRDVEVYGKWPGAKP